MAAAGCNNLIESSESISIPEQEIILTATRESLDSGTRSFRLDDGSVWWSPNEEVSVFYGSGSGGGSKFISMNTSISETVELQGTIQMSGSGKEFWAIYPYSEENACDGSSITTVIPSRQTGVEGNFSDDVFPAMAKGNSTSLPFWNICGGIKFFVSRNDIKSVTFRGNNGEVLAGKVKVSFNADGVPEVTEVVSGVNRVTLTAPDGGTFKPGKYYYITLLPIALEQGFTFTFETDSQVGTLKSDKANTIKRSIFGVLKNVDSKVLVWNDKFVDLGLSVKWAAWNLGASAPEDYGDYFAWGETEPKSVYNWTTYKWCNGDYDKLTKYCTNSSCWGSSNPMDYKTVLDTEDDAASVNWGGSWRMPTDAEWTELRNNCTWTWTSDYNGTGIAGRVVAASNGNSIFLPAAGYMDEIDLYTAGYHGCFWSSSNFGDKLRFVLFSSGGVGWNDAFRRYHGFTIRPVYGPFIPIEAITINNSSFEMMVRESVQLNVTISPSDASVSSVYWASGDNNVVSVDQEGNLLALSEGSTTITAYSSNGLSDSCVVVVKGVATVQEPEFVDLGLSVKWASFNLGASAPEGSGFYFAWGETNPKYDYSWSTYKHANGEYNKLIKYCPIHKSDWWDGVGEPDGLATLEPEDDAAAVMLGGKWRMPTDAEWKELQEHCTWTWTDNYNGMGIKGQVITASNGNSIFLPFASSRDGINLLATTYGAYWSSSLGTDRPDFAWYITIDNWRITPRNNSRSFGLSIRPVYGEFIPVESITLDNTSLELVEGFSTQFNATISPSNASARTIYWVSGDDSIVSVDNEGNASALAEGTTTITVYTSNGLSASCTVTVLKPEYKAVDLGLPSGLKWASFNVGAAKPEQFGEFFAWGETKPKYDYSWSTYKWCYGSNIPITKYCPSDKSFYWGLSGSPDNKTILDLEDDAAHAYWGGSWRTPTNEEWVELWNNCSSTWVSDYSGTGIAGQVVTSSNGNSIFLPAAGARDGTGIDEVGSRGYYYTSSLYSDIPYTTWCIYFGSDGVFKAGFYRYHGFSVRPVCP